MTYPLVLMVQTSPQARTPQSAPHIERRYCGNYIYSGPALSQILIDGGYITLDSSGNPSYHFYVQDHQGNNRLVLSASGGVEEVNSYYPYGGLMSMSTASTQRFKYNGKELNQHSYMMWYDYGARQSAPLLGRFTSMDQLCESYYPFSPYAYCVGNPVRFVDPDGERPKASEAALMAAYVYDKNNDKKRSKYEKTLEDCEWIVSKFSTSIQKDYTRFNENGLQSELFERTVNGTTEYAYVFAGTNSVEDVLEDIVQIAGVAFQYLAAISNARRLSKELGGKELTFIGHSLGGGEAIASSMATGRAVITFNPAAVSWLTKIIEGLNQTPDVVNYRATGTRIGIDNIIQFAGNQ